MRVHEKFLLSGSLLGGLALAEAVRRKRLPPRVMMAAVALLWAGFVLAISFLEAWVKFKAPFLSRHAAVDVGRHVFMALNAVEMGFAHTLLAILLASAAPWEHWKLPCLLGGITMLQFLYLTPALDLRAQRVIAAEADPQHLTDSQVRQLSHVRANVAAESLPPAFLHGIYVCAELAKLFVLGAFAVQLCKPVLDAVSIPL
ncbi:g4790 [Coccomyxa elongata]